MINPRLPSGVLELLPRQQVAFQRMLNTIRGVYERYGFLPVETPAFELTEVLLTKTGGETEKQVYFVQSTGALQQGYVPDLALHFDLTVPLARYVAQRERDLSFPFRRYQMQRSYRGERAQRGRFREFYQCDIDVIGKDSLPLTFDAELPAILAEIFQELKIGPFIIYLNNRKLILGLLEGLGIQESSRQTAIMNTLDKLDKIGREGVQEILMESRIGLTAAESKRLLDIIKLPGNEHQVLTAVQELKLSSDLLKEGLAEIESVLRDIRALGISEEVCRLNLSIIRGLDYYTGTVYEGVFKEDPAFGAICSGGRYENLAGHYTKSKLPGVGMSIGATRIFSYLLEKGFYEAEPGIADVLIVFLDPYLREIYLKLARDLRQAGINIEFYPEPAKLAKQIKHADKNGIGFALLVGSDEMAQGIATLKNLRTGSQENIPQKDLIIEIKKRVRR